MAEGRFGVIEGQKRLEYSEGIWLFDEDDWLLMAMLQDPVMMSELLFTDAKNKDYSGCYHVMDYQYSLFRHSHNYQIWPCARSVGKALADYEPVLTPGGWTRIADLTVGDEVVGSDGRPTQVLGVYPQGERELYAVTLKDGTTIECDADHLWTVTCDSWQSRRSGPRTLATDEIASRAENFKVPMPSAVQFDPSDPPEIEPWLVGALLGDGNVTRPTMIRFASIDVEIIERVRSLVGPDAELVHDGGCNYRVRSTYDGHGRRLACGLLRWSRRTGFHHKAAHEKRIPEEYMWGSIQTRIDLLRGLVDTDGSVTHAGSVEIGTASPGMAYDIRQLVLSLGGRASINIKPTSRRDCHRVVFRIEGVNPCWLERKRRRYEEVSAARVRDTAWRSIKSIERTGRGQTTCIKVAAVDGLFLANDFVLTHNTESLKARAVCHTFRRQGEDLLVAAPELIHLLPLTDQIEARIRNTRLTFEFLDTRNQKTGFTHKPFQVDYIDGTKIVGRIPKISGTGLKGMHEPDWVVDESQDFPEKGWIEGHETVMKDHVDREGNPDFTYHLYGVHSGARDGRFYKIATSGEFHVTTITALMRPGWGPDEKRRAAAIYGGTQAPDYRRNILGEAGGSSSAFFVTARLMACLDQDRESEYNTVGFKRQALMSEEVDKMLGEYPDKADRDQAMMELLRTMIDLPELTSQQIYFGTDVGLVNDPTVITLWAIGTVKGKARLKLVRMIHLWRFREKHIRMVHYLIGWKYGARLRAGGIDVTGLGLPMFQAMEDDEVAPKHLLEVARGYVFNAKVPIGIDKSLVSEDSSGMLRDHLGHIVEKEEDPFTGAVRYVVRMTMIEASTRYLRDMVDTGFMELPFDPEIVGDMQGETEQRVKAMAGMRKKPNAFHILDAMRGFAMAFKAADVDEQLKISEQVPVMARAVDVSHAPHAMG